ncbi:hypothetical protein TREMEDRAFT_70747 [Tremella mesenterica DSM 1558]|uniref:uncharacterized protein n=1 Tax=Tremella mesenterica (strain ATCC 24925 / CBS 8224 / DSM 1558 / NBRC 9311 / NRRL Y-6157 / RJB 2259-6 / UBC 559-6) TaxID=578456 RepID=UPI0003F4A271|nr:uncharacterized protein TREMEDRAFT_70747 [Tremella mesenterica DSM 1558]EIW72544.1 hypothetical protein TREMEDRAFT_70747 [Tremella mesenterica DSM 1558]
MASRARNGRRNGQSSNGGATAKSTSSQPLQGPLWNKERIEREYGAGISLKPQWAANAKSPLANHMSTNLGRAMDVPYVARHGNINGKKVYRVTAAVDPQQGIIGIGDHSEKKEAEKLAALSALLQLVQAGLIDHGDVKAKSGSTPSGSTPSPASGETAILSNGTAITYDRARQFMEYYCARYKFGKPDIDFVQSASKTRHVKTSTESWDAIMTVGGRRIGMGSAQNKKLAQMKCFLDVAQYLESCDQDLWQDFELSLKKGNKNGDSSPPPQLLFKLSNELSGDIGGLCQDIKQSYLFRNAPQSASNDESRSLPTWSSSATLQASEEELENKSVALKDKLSAYLVNPSLGKMRQQRQSLPVTSKAADIIATVDSNDVTIVMAATGSGKTTQIPQLLLDDYIEKGKGAYCNVLCTQPRRLAAMSVAERIADERGDVLGNEVGYQVRFDSKPAQHNGSITFCTTGIFLKRMHSALGETADSGAIKQMDSITHIVVDEVHERDIDTDLSLVVLKRLLADRKARGKPLKVILMSATIDPTLFKTYFADERGRPAPVAEIPGRTFPVERFYLDKIVPDIKGQMSPRDGWVFQDKSVATYLARELSEDPSVFGPNKGMELDIPYPLVALTIAYVMKRSADGHVLVFLPGWLEIKKVSDILLNGSNSLLGLRFSDSSKYSIHYLHSSIPAAEQKEVFRPPPEGVRRIILATNIAETSVTIPDVVYVVDTARVKEKRYDPHSHMSSLVSAWVGQSNLNQRAGRAGRHREGEYFGLLSKARYESLETHQLVEMKRSDLSEVVMHVKALNLGEVEEVLAAAIEPPDPSRIVAAMQTLLMLGALDPQQNLTSLGRVLLHIPIEAAIGKLLIYGSFFRCLDSALTLAAVLTNRDPFLSPPLMKEQADRIKASWSPKAFRSDPIAILAAYSTWSEMDDKGEWNRGSKFCSDNFLSKPTLLQIKQVRRSLLQSLQQAGVIAVSAGGTVRQMGRLREVPRRLNEHSDRLPLLAALIAMASAPNFAIRTSEKMCRTEQDKAVMIHPSSVNSNRRDKADPNIGEASDRLERKIYAFSEKTRNVPLGGKAESATTHIRNVTRLDPMTYLLFGAYRLRAVSGGIEADGWLSITGRLDILDDVQRLKLLVDKCLLRVFEGVNRSLSVGRDHQKKSIPTSEEHVENRGNVEMDDENQVDDDIESERESEDEDEIVNEGKRKVVEPLSKDEIRELELLTTDLIKILDAYAAERRGDKSRYQSRSVTPDLNSPMRR